MTIPTADYGYTMCARGCHRTRKQSVAADRLPPSVLVSRARVVAACCRSCALRGTSESAAPCRAVAAASAAARRTRCGAFWRTPLVPATGQRALAVGVQVPSFELYEMLAHVVLQVRKTSKEAAVNSTVGVLALNVLGAGGIGGSWQAGGLNAATRVECIADAAALCLAGGARCGCRATSAPCSMRRM